MSSVPRGWPGVTVPADYYDGEIFADNATSSPQSPVHPARGATFAARRPHPRLLAASWLAFGVVSLLYLPVFGRPEGLRLLAWAAVLILGSLHTRRDVVIADAGATLLVLRRTASPEADTPTPITSEQATCIRPGSPNRFVRYFWPELWQVGPERILVDSKVLLSLLHRFTETPT